MRVLKPILTAVGFMVIFGAIFFSSVVLTATFHKSLAAFSTGSRS